MRRRTHRSVEASALEVARVRTRRKPMPRPMARNARLWFCDPVADRCTLAAKYELPPRATAARTRTWMPPRSSRGSILQSGSRKVVSGIRRRMPSGRLIGRAILAVIFSSRAIGAKRSRPSLPSRSPPTLAMQRTKQRRAASSSPIASWACSRASFGDVHGALGPRAEGASQRAAESGWGRGRGRGQRVRPGRSL